jgi:cadmium resistance protein CadD (predicted permease)
MVSDLSTIIGLGSGAFLASNIDDLVILMFFFSNHRFPAIHVVLGQYVGMSLLLAVGLAGSLIKFVIPNNLIGLIGLIPIAIGIKELLGSGREKHEDYQNEHDNLPSDRKISQNRWITILPFLTVASITFSGGEEIGIYAAIFATNWLLTLKYYSVTLVKGLILE